MKRFTLNLTVFLLIQLIIWVAVIWIYGHCRPFGQHYLAASIDKQNLLKTAPSPRIVFLGGSNLAFGVDSGEVRSQLGYQPVNMGLHVELGLDFMLNEAKPSLRAGDVVVISPEYELFGEHYAGSGEILYTALEQHPGNVKFFSRHNLMPLLDNGFVLASRIVNYDISCLSGKKDAYDSNDPNNAYRRNGFNEYGDVISHFSLAPKTYEVPSIGSTIKAAHVDRSIADINDFGEFCRQRGVKVFYSYPTVSQPYFEKNLKAINQIAAALNRELKVPIIDSPGEMNLPADDFYDTYYHLTRAGIAKRTKHLIEKLHENGINKPVAQSQRTNEPHP